MTDWLRDLIKDRRKVFHSDHGRSTRWKMLKKRTARIVKKRRRKFDANIIDKLESETNPGNFFKHIGGLLGTNEKPRWTPCDMYPNLPPQQVAEELASFFNAISNEYLPLNPAATPTTFDRSLPTIT